jgi:TPR repeat protein
MARLSCLLMFLVLWLPSAPAVAGGIEDADKRLYQAQLALAMKGDPRAQYFLGEMHEQGLGTKQDVDEAFKWYAKAAEQGDVLAKRKLSMRKEIEQEINAEKTLEAIPPPAVPQPKNVPPKPAEKHRPAPAATARAEDIRAAEEEAKRQQAIQAAREKRRAAVRAMILERIRHPVGDPFE